LGQMERSAPFADLRAKFDQQFAFQDLSRYSKILPTLVLHTMISSAGAG
jgi:hypothetical protein